MWPHSNRHKGAIIQRQKVSSPPSLFQRYDVCLGVLLRTVAAMLSPAIGSTGKCPEYTETNSSKIKLADGHKALMMSGCVQLIFESQS